MLVALSAIPVAMGHEPVNKQLQHVNAKLAVSPRDARLYVDRARLHIEDGHHRRAIRDLRRSLELDSSGYAAYYFLGTAHLRLGHARQAEKAAQQFLAALASDNAGAHFRGYVLLAEAQTEATKFADAAASYQQAAQHGTQLRPEHYLAHASVLERAGEVDEAIAVVNRGLAQLGAVPSLQLRVVEMLEVHRRDEAVLTRLEHLERTSPQPADWYRRHGDVLAQMGRGHDARARYRDALAAIDRLSDVRRRSPAMLELRAEIERRLAMVELEAPTSH